MHWTRHLFRCLLCNLRDRADYRGYVRYNAIAMDYTWILLLRVSVAPCSFIGRRGAVFLLDGGILDRGIIGDAELAEEVVLISGWIQDLL